MICARVQVVPGSKVVEVVPWVTSALHGPGHRVRIVRTFRHVPEVMRPGCRGRALGPPQQSTAA